MPLLRYQARVSPWGGIALDWCAYAVSATVGFAFFRRAWDPPRRFTIGFLYYLGVFCVMPIYGLLLAGLMYGESI
jgi:hypothetical protein